MEKEASQCDPQVPPFLFTGSCEVHKDGQLSLDHLHHVGIKLAMTPLNLALPPMWLGMGTGVGRPLEAVALHPSLALRV